MKSSHRKDRKKKNNLEKQQLAKNRQNSSATSTDARPVHAIGLSTDKGFFVVSKEVLFTNFELVIFMAFPWHIRNNRFTFLNHNIECGFGTRREKS